MEAQMVKSSGSPARIRKEEALEYRLLYALSFGLFLLAAAAARVVPFGRRHGGLSIVGEAKLAASTCIPFAFMG
jgi:hypothetical protein